MFKQFDLPALQLQALVRPIPLLVAPAHKSKQRRREGGSNSQQQQQQQHKHKQTRKPVKVRLTPHAHTYIRTVKYLLSRFCLLLAWKIKKQAEGNTCGKELDERTTTKQQEKQKQNKTNQLRASGEKQNKTVKNLHAKAEIIIILSPVCVRVFVFVCGMCGSHKG